MKIVGIILTTLGIIGALTSFTNDLIILGFVCCTVATMGFFMLATSLEFSEAEDS